MIEEQNRTAIALESAHKSLELCVAGEIELIFNAGTTR